MYTCCVRHPHTARYGGVSLTSTGLSEVSITCSRSDMGPFPPPPPSGMSSWVQGAALDSGQCGSASRWGPTLARREQARPAHAEACKDAALPTAAWAASPRAGEPASRSQWPGFPSWYVAVRAREAVAVTRRAVEPSAALEPAQSLPHRRLRAGGTSVMGREQGISGGEAKGPRWVTRTPLPGQPHAARPWQRRQPSRGPRPCPCSWQLLVRRGGTCHRAR